MTPGDLTDAELEELAQRVADAVMSTIRAFVVEHVRARIAFAATGHDESEVVH